MKTLELIYIGIRGSVVALDRATGAQVWATKLRSGDFVSVLVEGNALYATTYGELFCLESATGKVLWHNPLKGFGTGPAMIATRSTPGAAQMTFLAEKQRRDREAAAAGATAAVMASS